MSRQSQYSRNESVSLFGMAGHSAGASVPSPGSPDSFTMDGQSRLGDTRAYDNNYSPLPVLGSGSRSSFNDYQSIGVTHNHQAFPQNNVHEQAIYKFIDNTGGNAEPWNPLKANADPTARQSGAMMNYGLSGYPNFHTAADPSECDDSGYFGSMSGSMAIQSVVESSVYGDTDRGIDTQSISQPLNEYQPQNGRAADIAHVEGKRQDRDPWSQQRIPAHSDNPHMYCTVCKILVKTKAELNKHKQRHDKPFHCDVPGCSRKLGFGTSNDLARHKQCVHNAVGPKFRCPIGPCLSKRKDWPRADNFRQHLKRVHNHIANSDEDMKQFEYQPSRDEDLACLGTSEAQADMPVHPAHLSQSTWMDLDQTQPDLSGLPSGETSYHLESSVEFLESQTPARQLDHDAFESNRSQMEMDSALSGYGYPQRHTQDAQHPSPEELYAASQVCKADPVDPVSLETRTFNEHGVAEAQRPEPVQDGEDDRHDLRELDCQDEEAGPESNDPDQPALAVQEQHQDDFEDDAHYTDAEADTVEDSNEYGSSDSLPEALEPLPAKASTASCDSESAEVVDSTKGSPPSTPQLATDILESMSLDETKAVSLVQSLLENGMLYKILEKCGYQKPKEEEVKGEDRGSPIPFEESPNKCDDCPKRFNRPCELKKHKKRHEKPYACTHAECMKKFGSKNDWKRHENSQHIQLEYWRCGDKARDRDSQCGKICHRRETFRIHLEKDHDIVEPKVIEKRCSESRIGRNFESRYWCGFCQKTIEFTKNGGHAWSERFNHIDEHFVGRNREKMDIKDWKSIELEPLETFQTILPDTRSLKRSSEPAPLVAQEPPGSLHRDGSSRKRALELEPDVPALQAKRARPDKGKSSMMWTCCSCGNYWAHATTSICMDPDCAHAHCDYCGKL